MASLSQVFSSNALIHGCYLTLLTSSSQTGGVSVSRLSRAALRAKSHLASVALWPNLFIHTCVTSGGMRSNTKADKFMIVTTTTMITVCWGYDSLLITMVTDSKSSPTDQTAWELHPVFTVYSEYHLYLTLPVCVCVCS